MAKKRCHKCNGTRTEKVDITSAKDTASRYFIRCKNCGLVLAVSEQVPTKPAKPANPAIGYRLFSFLKRPLV